jgi:hypothetical protein
VLKGRLILILRRHHLRLNRPVVRRSRPIIVVVIVIHLALAIEICRAFVLANSTIL